MDNTIIQQGRFTSTGDPVTLQIRSDVDWMAVYNYTQAANGTGSSQGVKYYWQRGMNAGTGLQTTKTITTLASVDTVMTTGGFTLVDSTNQQPGPLVSTITAISTAAIPVVTNTGTNGLAAGDVVRLINVAGTPQLGAMDFTVGINTLSATTFSLDFMPQLTTAGTTGSFRKISTSPLFYPRRRFITSITAAAQAVVTMSVRHDYQVGQVVRFIVPQAFGMTQINGLTGTITAISASGSPTLNSITVNIDTSAFTAFTFPLAGAVPFSAAEVVPVGENTPYALSQNQNILSDATINTGYIGMLLGGGANGPAGANNDVVYWVAGKSFNVSNT